jgi:hypothetical protein
MRGASALSLFLAPQLLIACNCLVSQSVCREVVTSNRVFIGTVESVQPSLLDPWNPSSHRDWMQDPEIVELSKNKSESGLRVLKERYLKLLFDLPTAEKMQIQTAETQEDLHSIITWIVGQGTTVRFKIRMVFQWKEDSDSDTKDASKDTSDDDPKIEFAEVWDEPGDCGIPFQKGETYLVYATDDEETNRLQTNVCQRTARVSDAGEDLAYLYFLKNGGAQSLRLEGFVTSEIDQLHQDPFHYSAGIKSPVSDVVVELSFAGGVRYTQPDPSGRFVFDGLAAGNYRVSALSAESPDRGKTLSGPTRVLVQTGKCAMTTLLILSRGSGH